MDLGRCLLAQRFDAGAQAAFAASGFIPVDKALVDRGVNHRGGFAESGLGFFDIARGNRVQNFLDVGAQPTAGRCILDAVLFRSKDTFFCGFDISQGKAPNVDGEIEKRLFSAIWSANVKVIIGNC